MTVENIHPGDNAVIEIYDLLGRERIHESIPGNPAGQVMVDVSKLEEGIYLLKVFSNEKVVGVRKVIVRR